MTGSGRRGAPPSPERIQRYYSDRLADAGGCCSGVVALEAPTAATLEVPSFGCGEPTLFAGLEPGERVLDLGSGAGLDAFRAAEAVGARGSVMGVDMTPAMLRRARDGAERLGLSNVTFVEGVIEALPLADGAVDVVLSNCVVNLSRDKAAVFREAFRVLRPGGRLTLSDILRAGPAPAAVAEEGWCACIDGAESADVYAALLREAGFAEVSIGAPPAGPEAPETYSAVVRAVRPDIRAVRPEEAREAREVRDLLRNAGLPVDGLDAPETRTFAVRDGHGVMATVAVEDRGEAALLRSLAVRDDARGRGYGTALLRHAEAEARRAGARRAYALTTTVAAWLPRFGYRAVAREALPPELSASAELQGACPASARAFVRDLA